MIPEITTTELAAKLKSDEKFILLDVREPVELEYAKLTDTRLEVTPMSRLAEEGLDALSESARSQDVVIYILCHHGNRSGQVAAWLAQSQGAAAEPVRAQLKAWVAEYTPSR